MIGWFIKKLQAKDDGGMDAKREAVKCKREAAESALRLLNGTERREEDSGNTDGPERRHGPHLAHTDPLPQV